MLAGTWPTTKCLEVELVKNQLQVEDSGVEAEEYLIFSSWLYMGCIQIVHAALQLPSGAESGYCRKSVDPGHDTTSRVWYTTGACSFSNAC